MKSNKFIIAAIVAIVPAAAALAQTAQQQVADAVRNGEIVTGEMGVPMRAAPLATSGISRAQVQRELHQANANMTAGNGETGTAGDATQIAGTRTRAEVRAEAMRAVRNGEIVAGEAGTLPVGHSNSGIAIARGADATVHPAN